MVYFRVRSPGKQRSGMDAELGEAPPSFPGCNVGPVQLQPGAPDADTAIAYWYPALSIDDRVQIWILLTPRARRAIQAQLRDSLGAFLGEDGPDSPRVRHYLQRGCRKYRGANWPLRATEAEPEPESAPEPAAEHAPDGTPVPEPEPEPEPGTLW